MNLTVDSGNCDLILHPLFKTGRVLLLPPEVRGPVPRLDGPAREPPFRPRGQEARFNETRETCNIVFLFCIRFPGLIESDDEIGKAAHVWKAAARPTERQGL